MKKEVKIVGMLFLFSIALALVYLEKAHAQTWVAAGSHPQYYEMGANPMVSHGSENAGFIRSTVSQIDWFGTYMTTIKPGQYPGKGLKLTAYVKTANATGGAYLWMRVDGEGLNN
jgi:hypothetical protein